MDDRQHRQNRLRETKKRLEAEIELELRRPNPDSIVLHHLKREKLLIKEELYQTNTTT